MSVGKYLSFEEVRRDPKLRTRFMKEHPSAAEKERFEALLEAMCQPVKTPLKRRSNMRLGSLPHVVSELELAEIF